MDGTDIAKNVVEGAIIFISIFYISTQLQNMSVDPNISQNYVVFYSGLAAKSLVTSLALIIFRIKIGAAFDIPRNYKIGIILAWILFILVISYSGNQIMPVPSAKAVAEFQMTADQQIWTSSVIPGVLEDWDYLFVLPTLLIVGILLGLEYGLGIELDGIWMILLVVGVCLLASLGHTWMFPGFTSAHIGAYQECQNCYTGAFVFGFGQSMVYMFTNTFVPVAHIAHNAIVTFQSMYSVAPAPMAVITFNGSGG